jgi:LysR family transcriptional regulator, regulator for genes of the gallate degradation pathway
MELDSRQLTYLLAIAREGSFSKAAARLQMSQPTLSNAVAQLERRIGGVVFTRGRHGAQLTDIGRMLARHAELLEIQMGRAVQDVLHHRAGRVGPLVIGVTPVAAADLVPRALARLRWEMPNAVVSIVEMVFSEAMDALLKGVVDMVVGPVGVYPRVEGVEEERLATDPLSVIVRAGHALSHRRATSLHQLQNVQWVLPSDRSAFHRQLEALFVTVGLGWPTGAVLTNSMTALRAVVIHGDGVAIMPRQLVALERRAGLLHCIRLLEAGASRALGLSRASGRALSPVAERFAEIVRACARPRAAAFTKVNRRTSSIDSH